MMSKLSSYDKTKTEIGADKVGIGRLIILGESAYVEGCTQNLVFLLAYVVRLCIKYALYTLCLHHAVSTN